MSIIPTSSRRPRSPTGSGVGRRSAGGALRHEVLTEYGLVGWPKTSGSRPGIHVNVRIVARWDFAEVRRAALALAPRVERRLPTITVQWWEEEKR